MKVIFCYKSMVIANQKFREDNLVLIVSSFLV
jgi:hypothetical protein